MTHLDSSNEQCDLSSVLLPSQHMQGLLDQVSDGLTVEDHPAESSDLIQQLDDLRQTSAAPLRCWFSQQVDEHLQVTEWNGSVCTDKILPGVLCSGSLVEFSCSSL